MLTLPIESERIRLRRFVERDRASFVSFMQNETSNRYLMFDADECSDEGANQLVDRIMASYADEVEICSYVVADLHSDRYLGTAGFTSYDVGVMECYFGINEEFCGHGYATEALVMLRDVLMPSYQLRVYCHDDNQLAHRVALAAGFKLRGAAVNKNSQLSGQLFVYKQGV
ncbi:GNAT family N-acetyltransferase [Persicirhabdus sediminis]|uniref:GNAT family N-acetyltransferase n=1 Tax=Persicirhabdus sediminis TaxID=454144 RepID=A0A8J7MEZ3_9BACT|nr:GNAT family N-acetyltransferase [Persicirhabdus sediminis]MBK1791465.1 GNAT family N-acetyltransferase [Persicirhabdus sediminis]